MGQPQPGLGEQDSEKPAIGQSSENATTEAHRPPLAIHDVPMDGLIRYHVRVETGKESRFEIRDPRSLREGDRFEWHGNPYEVGSVTFDPDGRRQAVVMARRITRDQL